MNESGLKLSASEAELNYHNAAKLLFLYNHAQPDIQTVVPSSALESNLQTKMITRS